MGGGGAQNASLPPFWSGLSLEPSSKLAIHSFCTVPGSYWYLFEDQMSIFLVKGIQTLINWEWAQSRSEGGTPSIPCLLCYWYASIYIFNWEFSKTFWLTLIPSFNVLICQKTCSNSKPYIAYKIPFIILFVMVWRIILMELGGRSKMLAER